MLQIVRVTHEMPEGFEILRRDAVDEEWRHLNRLADEWDGGAVRYDGDGEAFLAAFEDGVLAGVGVVCMEPNTSYGPARRMRRFYVRPQFRGRGVGRTLATALMQQGWAAVPLLTVHAGRPEAARFWEHLGFQPDEGNGWSHSLRHGWA
jgi:GNAT superfamily N-acetyltransferase